jgi:hypothetical protein
MKKRCKKLINSNRLDTKGFRLFHKGYPFSTEIKTRDYVAAAFR